MTETERLYSEWQSLQPVSPEVRKMVNEKFNLEFNFNSNHMEGNTLTYGQTKLLLIFGETSGSASLRDYEEMKAHNVGLKMVEQEALDRERPLTESFIRELNRTILVQNFWKNATTPDGQDTRMEVKVGEYKSRPNSVITTTGEIFNYAAPEETQAFMTDLVDWYNEEAERGVLSPVELAALLHYRYIRIHPFEDGNGRIARLLVNFVFHRYGYPMVVIRSEDKQTYLRVLHLCDVQVGLTLSDGASAQLDKIEPFVKYLSQQLQRAFNLCIKAAKGGNIEEDDDFEKKIALLKRKTEEKKIAKSSDVVRSCIFRFLDLAVSIEQRLESVKTMFDNYYILYERSVLVLTYDPNSESPYESRIYSNEKRHDSVSRLFAVFKSDQYDFFSLDSFTIIYRFSHFKSDGENTFNYSSPVTIKFDLNDSVISGNCLLSDKVKAYNDEYSDEELKAIEREFCNGVLREIENNLK